MVSANNKTLCKCDPMQSLILPIKKMVAMLTWSYACVRGKGAIGRLSHATSCI